MIQKLLTLFKPKTISVIIFDGKTMQYRSLTQKALKRIQNDPACKDWIITINEEPTS